MGSLMSLIKTAHNGVFPERLEAITNSEKFRSDKVVSIDFGPSVLYGFRRPPHATVSFLPV